MRLDVRRIETLKDGQEMVGNRTRVKVVKNKVAPPFKQAEFDILYGKGISREGSLIDLGVDTGIIRKAGAWFTYDADQLGQGRENARSYLRNNPDLADELEKKIKERMGIGPKIDLPAGSIRSPARWSSSQCPSNSPRSTRSARARSVTGVAAAESSSEGLTETHGDHADAESVARTIALRRLTMRAHTRHELDQALQAKNVPQSAKMPVLDRIEEVGLVDDATFAVDWVTSRQQRRHLSRRALRRELQVEGSRARRYRQGARLCRSRCRTRSCSGPGRAKTSSDERTSRDVQYRRLAGLLSRRGFDTAVMTRVLTDVLQSELVAARQGQRDPHLCLTKS